MLYNRNVFVPLVVRMQENDNDQRDKGCKAKNSRKEMEMEKRDTINYTATCEDVPKESVSRE